MIRVVDMVRFQEDVRKVEEHVTSIEFEVVGPYEVVKNWVDNTVDYIGRFIHHKVRGDVESNGLVQKVRIEVARPLTVTEKFTIKLLVYSLGRALLNDFRLSTILSKEVDNIW